MFEIDVEKYVWCPQIGARTDSMVFSFKLVPLIVLNLIENCTPYGTSPYGAGGQL